eukprot:TRINITY_DN801_c0_g1_i3.p1 TRINITY_DN801_c0_g1~~TRINITY_DN801_c0_g1_i3.p1  ORF type:complete len:545 (-),score=209.59 TRINITY_DN801_c0_g1_i3:54-1688(-)
MPHVEVNRGLWNEALRIEKLHKKKKILSDRRYFVLSKEFILYWFKEKNSLRAQNSLNFDEYELIDVESKTFLLKPRREGSKSYELVCPSKESKEEWASLKIKRNIMRDQEERGQFIKREDLEITEEKIGEGASSTIMVGKWRGSEVAVKILKNNLSDSEKESFYNEIKVLSKMNHPHLVRTHGFSVDKEKIVLVSELVRGGDLDSFIRWKKKYEWKDSTILRVAINVARGMQFIHSNGLIHRDLKPENILIEDLEEAKIKICDYGISKSSTPIYAAPELREAKCTNKVDVFSFGLIVWEMFSRKTPFEDEMLFSSQIEELYKKGERPKIPEGCPAERVILNCWSQDPTNRKDFKTITDQLEVVLKKLGSETATVGGTEQKVEENGEKTPTNVEKIETLEEMEPKMEEQAEEPQETTENDERVEIKQVEEEGKREDEKDVSQSERGQENVQLKQQEENVADLNELKEQKVEESEKTLTKEEKVGLSEENEIEQKKWLELPSESTSGRTEKNLDDLESLIETVQAYSPEMVVCTQEEGEENGKSEE